MRSRGAIARAVAGWAAALALATHLAAAAPPLEADDPCSLGPPRKSLRLEDTPFEAFGDYLRVHPKGCKIIFSGGELKPPKGVDSDDDYDSGPAQMIDICAKPPRATRLPWGAEPYPVYDPVRGDWSLIAFPVDGRVGDESVASSRADLAQRKRLGGEGMSFIPFADIVSQGARAPLPRVRDESTGKSAPFVEHELVSYYHSVGTLPGATARKATFRVYGNYNDHKTRDITVTFDGRGRPVSTKFGPTRPFCSSILDPSGRRLEPEEIAEVSTLNVSRDGREFAANMVIAPATDNQTVILERSNEGECRITEQLGFTTSKVDFSPRVQGSRKGYISFTASRLGPALEYGQLRPSGQTWEVGFVYDRDAKVLREIKPAPECGSRYQAHYPAVTEGGKVVFRESCTRRDGKAVSMISSMPMPDGPGVPLGPLKTTALCVDCVTMPQAQEQLARFVRIGKIWEKVCRGSLDRYDPLEWNHAQETTWYNAGNLNLYAETTRSARGAALTPEGCRTIVTRAFASLKLEKYEGLTQEQLLATCERKLSPDAVVPAAAPAPVAAAGESRTLAQKFWPLPVRAEQLQARAIASMNSNCIDCHTSGVKPGKGIVFLRDALPAQEHWARIARAVYLRRVPPQGVFAPNGVDEGADLKPWERRTKARWELLCWLVSKGVPNPAETDTSDLRRARAFECPKTP